MRRDRVLRFLLWTLIAFSLLLFAFYYLTLTLYHGSFVWFEHLFPDEPKVQEIVELSAENPRVQLPDLLDEAWDYACFVTPYHDVEGDPMLAGVEIPWINSDAGYAVVLKRGADYDLHRIDRGRVVSFERQGLSDGEACYDSIDVALEYVAGDNPITVRVVPMH